MTDSQKYAPRFSRRIFMQKSPKKAYFQFPISSQSQKMGENQAIFPNFFGAAGRARTDTNSRSRDFKSLASANSTTAAHFLYEICIYSFSALTQQILSPLRLPIPPQRQAVCLDRKEDIGKPMPFVWRRHPDLNRGVRVLQTLALPLGYGAKKNSAELCLERETRFEPATSTLARWRSTTELFPHKKLSALYWWKL